MPGEGILNDFNGSSSDVVVSFTNHWVRCETTQAVQNNWEFPGSHPRCNCFLPLETARQMAWIHLNTGTKQMWHFSYFIKTYSQKVLDQMSLSKDCVPGKCCSSVSVDLKSGFWDARSAVSSFNGVGSEKEESPEQTISFVGSRMHS